MLEVNTFSISARCQRSGMLGVAVSTAVPAVGGICPFVEAGVGAISTQSWVNPYLGIDGLKLLRAGKSAEQALDELMGTDPGREVRQIGIVDANGGSAAWSGRECTAWFGHVTGPDYSVQGNMLVGESTISSMAEAFIQSSSAGLPERLVIALEAGQKAGGDKRGRQSAALLVYKTEGYPYLSLRVDDHAHPVAELRRVFEVARQQLLPFVDGMPSRTDPLGSLPKSVTDMLMTPPPFRPGGGGSGL
jgi:uncharacterized Ntn-hydrolase superfamily protein